MLDTIRKGTVLIKKNTVFPQGLWFASKPSTPDWRLVENLDGCGLERKVREAGWNFFYLAGEITTTVFGSHGPEKAWSAVTRILAMQGLENSNSLEVTCVTRARFLGVPYTKVVAHARHIQESVFLFRAGSPQASDPVSTDHRASRDAMIARAEESMRGNMFTHPDSPTVLNFVFSKGGSK